MLQRLVATSKSGSVCPHASVICGHVLAQRQEAFAEPSF